MTRILIVDDEKINVMFLSTALKKYGSCDQAYDGQEALGCFIRAHENHDPYDLVLLDIMMPVMDGQEALAKIREYEKNQGKKNKTVVIMTTALDDAENMIKSFSDECNEYLTKPIRLKDIKAELKKHNIELIKNDE